MSERSTRGSQLASPQAMEEKRVFRFTAWLSHAGSVCLVLIAAKSAWSGAPLHATILLGFAVALMGNHLIAAISANYDWQRRGLIVLILALFAYLISTGGENNTGPLWFYVLPPLAFFITGLKAGLILVTVCLAYALIVFQLPELPFVTTRYHPDFQLRFVATVMFTTAFCAILDHRRRQVHRELVSIAQLYERAAKTDELTALPNRRAMQNQLIREISRYQRAGHHFSVILMDLDHFKEINDNFGHDAGDEVLVEFANLLRETCRGSDVVSRWGGEEFLMLLPDTSLLQALTLAERLRQMVAEFDFEYQGRPIPVTLSAGVCSISQTETIEALLKQADVHLYRSKAQGRNRITPGVRQPHDEKMPKKESARDRI